jgi:hypothetical protein
MSMRETERRKRRAKRRADSVGKEIARKRRNTELLAKEARRRADQVKRRITVGDVEPRPLPSEREDSLPSIDSMESSESIASMESTESAALTGGVPSEEEAYSGGDMGEDVSLGTDSKGAHEEPG